jgi:hypothetical protein
MLCYGYNLKLIFSIKEENISINLGLLKSWIIDTHTHINMTFNILLG